MNKKRILLIHNIFSPHTEKVFRQLSKKCKLHVLYCAKSEKNRNWSIVPQDYSYEFLSGLTIAWGKKDLFSFIVNPFIIDKIINNKPDMVIISGWDLPTYWIAAFFCRLKNIPYIVWSGSTKNEQSWRRSISLPLVKLILRWASSYIAYGSLAKDYLISLGVNPEKITIAFNGFDYDFYNKYKPDKKNINTLMARFSARNKKILLYYGQLIERKNPLLLIEAFQKLQKTNKDLVLLIVGNGNLSKKLNTIVYENKIKNVFIDPNPGDSKIRNYISISDLFVLPSSEEVWGLVINQALAMGKPIIVSDKVGAQTDLLIEGKNGFIFKSEDKNSLVDSLKKALISNFDKRCMYEMAKLCSPDIVSNRIMQSIEMVFESKNNLLKIINLPLINDDCRLIFGQKPNIPFDIKRIYYISNSKLGLSRGYHAHKETQQIFFCIQGSVKLLLDDGKNQEAVIVSKANEGVLIDKMIWHEMHDITSDAIMLVLASKEYNEDDYVRSYATFVSSINNYAKN
jgi:glycosyltransferase involved in cell wall biosynthesis